MIYSHPSTPYRLAVAILLLATTAPGLTADTLSKQYVGRWQVNRIMQEHKLPYYPRGCDAAKDIREIVAINPNTIEIRGEKQPRTYQVGQDNSGYFFEHRGRTKVLWEIPGDTFLHGAGTYWNAYRRCTGD
jgi:hypothetical protein